MTLAQMLADLYRRTGFTSTPASEVTTRMTAFLNETQQEMFEEPGIQYLLDDQINIVSVANQALYGLPTHLLSIKAMRDATNKRTLSPMSLGMYRSMYPDPSINTGIPSWWVDLGMSEVVTQPMGVQLYVQSTSASDTGTVYLEGYFAANGGAYGNTSVVMTGVTPALLGSGVTHNITKFFSSVAAVGIISLTNMAGSIIYTQIAAGDTVPRFRRLALVPTPTSVVTYNLDVQRTIADMAISTDEPILPIQFHRVLLAGARAKEYEKQRDAERWQMARTEYMAGMKKLKYYAFKQVEGSPNLARHVPYRTFSNAVQVTTS